MKAKTLLILMAMAGAALLYTGCFRGMCIHGNDILSVEYRIVPEFDAISSEGFFDIFIIQDTTWEVTVEAESNLQPYIYTAVRGNTLIIKEQAHHCIKNNLPIRITVRCGSINEISLTGSGNVIGETDLVSNYMNVALSGSGNMDMYVEAPSIDATIAGSGNIDLGMYSNSANVNISGSGNFSLWGETNRTDLTITGSGNIAAYGLIQDICFATISGSGNMFVFVNDLLDVKITGSGSVYYKGHPDVVTVITGSGSVINQN